MANDSFYVGIGDETRLYSIPGEPMRLPGAMLPAIDLDRIDGRFIDSLEEYPDAQLLLLYLMNETATFKKVIMTKSAILLVKQGHISWAEADKKVADALGQRGKKPAIRDLVSLDMGTLLMPESAFAGARR